MEVGGLDFASSDLTVKGLLLDATSTVGPSVCGGDREKLKWDGWVGTVSRPVPILDSRVVSKVNLSLSSPIATRHSALSQRKSKRDHWIVDSDDLDRVASHPYIW